VKSKLLVFRIAPIFFITCSVSILISTFNNWPLEGSIGICPEMNRIPASVIREWLYGATGFGVSFV
jgi:hypothetical protein